MGPIEPRTISANGIDQQPMVTQTRHVLDRYAAAGGRYREVVFERCGHSPHVEHPRLFATLVVEAVS